MNWTRRQIFHQMAMLAAAVASARGGYAFAASGPGASIVDLGIDRRGRTGPFPKIVKTPAELVTARLVLPYDRANALRPDSYPTYTYKPGDFAVRRPHGLHGPDRRSGRSRPGDGSRGFWLTGGSPNNMLAQAEAHGSVPVHQTIDGRVIDVFKHPLASVDIRGAKPHHDISVAQVKPDTPHYPALSYVPFLATRDLYYLAELQFAATYHINGSAVAYAQGKGILFPWQQRGLAWGLRDVIAAYIATLEAEKAGPLPEPLLPSTHWKQIIDNNVAFLTKEFVNSPNPLNSGNGLRRLLRGPAAICRAVAAGLSEHGARLGGVDRQGAADQAALRFPDLPGGQACDRAAAFASHPIQLAERRRLDLGGKPGQEQPGGDA